MTNPKHTQVIGKDVGQWTFVVSCAALFAVFGSGVPPELAAVAVAVYSPGPETSSGFPVPVTGRGWGRDGRTFGFAHGTLCLCRLGSRAGVVMYRCARADGRRTIPPSGGE